MAQVYEPCDVIERALKSLSIDYIYKLPKFYENEIDDASIMTSKPWRTWTAPPHCLGGCMPSGTAADSESTRVHCSIQGSAGAPQASACRQSSARCECGQTDSPLEEVRERQEEQRRVVAEKALVDAMARDLPVLRLAIALTQVQGASPREAREKRL